MEFESEDEEAWFTALVAALSCFLMLNMRRLRLRKNIEEKNQGGLGPGKGNARMNIQEDYERVDVYSILCERPEGEMKTHCGFTRQHFDELVEEIGPAVSLPRDLNATRNRPCKSTLENRVLLVLLWLRNYNSYKELAVMFGMTVATVCDEIHHVLPIMIEELRYEITWPTQEERMQLFGTIPGFPEAIGLIDGTKQRTIRTSGTNQDYNGHCKAYVRNAQAVCAFDGTFLDFEPGFIGSTHDSTMYRSSSIGMGLDEHFANDAYLLADTAYLGMPQLFATYRSNQLVGHPERVVFNKVLAAGRVHIERGFSYLKMKFGITRQKWHHYDQTLQSHAMLAAALLCNRMRRFYST